MPNNITNTEYIIIQTIIGILSIFGAAFIGWLFAEVIKLLNAKTRNELIKINFKNIKYFIPSISSFLVLACEIWFISPHSIIDFMFIQLSVFLLVFNISLVVLIGYLEVNRNYYIGRNLALYKKYKEAKGILAKSEAKLDKSNRDLSEFISSELQRTDLTPHARKDLERLLAKLSDIKNSN